MDLADKLTFEEAFARVEEITQILSLPNTAVDEMVKLYQEASVLLAFCQQKLAEAKLEVDRVEVVSKQTSLS